MPRGRRLTTTNQAPPTPDHAPPTSPPADPQTLLHALDDRRGIGRMHDRHCAASWSARVYHAGAAVSRSFADRTYGGMAAALAAAVAWRDALRHTLLAADPPARPRTERTRRRG